MIFVAFTLVFFFPVLKRNPELAMDMRPKMERLEHAMRNLEALSSALCNTNYSPPERILVDRVELSEQYHQQWRDAYSSADAILLVYCMEP